MKITEIYEKYKIMPQLQMHMLRSAAVAKLICNHYTERVDSNLIISAMIIHDLGNMSMINLERFPDLIPAEGKEYWEKILSDFKQKYGDDDYQSTYKILKELKIPNNLQRVIRSNEYIKFNETAKSDNLTQKICLYSDARSMPRRVGTIDERFKDTKERFIKRRGCTEEFYQELWESARKVEKQIFSKCNIKSEDISEESVKPIIEELKSFDVTTQN